MSGCAACKSTGEVETGIGMMVCDECGGSGVTQKPIGTVASNGFKDSVSVLWHAKLEHGMLLYAAPPKRQWVDLDNADFKAILELDFGGNRIDCMKRAIERFKEKNA